MSDGRFTMRGYAFQGYASAPWALAGRIAAVVVTGCIVETAVYSGGIQAGEVYRPGLKSGDTYSGGMKEGQAGR